VEACSRAPAPSLSSLSSPIDDAIDALLLTLDEDSDRASLLLLVGLMPKVTLVCLVPPVAVDPAIVDAEDVVTPLVFFVPFLWLDWPPAAAAFVDGFAALVETPLPRTPNTML